MTDTWTADWSVSPGEVLAETLDERGMTQSELGKRMARPLKTISEIANGKAAITPETAIQLERALGISASVWLGLESNYRESLARARDREELDAHVSWLKRFPIRALIERQIIDDAPATHQVAQLLQYFGVSSPAGWEQHWGRLAASYRMHRQGAISPEAVATWLCIGEKAASEQLLGEYDPQGLRAVLGDARSLSRVAVFAAATDELRRRLAGVGVALVLVEGLPQAPASSAVRWVRDRPLIEVALRYRTEDQFWFSVYHEAGHLLEGGRRTLVVEELVDVTLDTEEERVADGFARDLLVPSAPLEQFVAAGDLSRAAVRAFGAEIDVSPGIVVGRLQRDRVIGPSALNDVKVPLGRDRT